jgi:hypothetical protein
VWALRDGAEAALLAEELVPGDVIILTDADTVRPGRPAATITAIRHEGRHQHRHIDRTPPPAIITLLTALRVSAGWCGVVCRCRRTACRSSGPLAPPSTSPTSSPGGPSRCPSRTS